MHCAVHCIVRGLLLASAGLIHSCSTCINSGLLPGLHPDRQNVVDNAELVFQLLFTIELVFKVCFLPLSIAVLQCYQLLSSASLQSELMVVCRVGGGVWLRFGTRLPDGSLEPT